MIKQYLSVYAVTVVIEELLILVGGDRYFPAEGCRYATGFLHAIWIAALVNVMIIQIQRIMALEKESRELDRELKQSKKE